MFLPGVAALLVGVLLAYVGYRDYRRPEGLDSWNRNPSIPRAGSRGRLQMDGFLAALGLVFAATGIAVLFVL